MSPKPRRLHIDIEPAVDVDVSERRVRFVGLNLINAKVMVEYDVDPPMNVDVFGPHLLVVDVRDDVSDEPYDTFWWDFPWGRGGGFPPGRMTTRLQRRPPAPATRLDFVIRPAEPPEAGGRRPVTSRLAPVARFSVALPAEHGEPWQDRGPRA